MVDRKNKQIQKFIDPGFSSWGEYLEQVPWSKLKQRCVDTANRANRPRVSAPPPKLRLAGFQVWNIFKNSQGRCAHCRSLAVECRPSSASTGAPLPWEPIGRRIGSLDHLLPRSSGGDNELSNLVWSCLWCNTWPKERRAMAGDHGGFYPDVSVDPDPALSEIILANKYIVVTGCVWSAETAFATRPRQARSDEDEVLDEGDDSAFEMFPDHECPSDIAMVKQLFS